ncbi:MAG TPA: DUF5990 family protein [Bryobacteraceae bacterium]|jgi:hypothetical protein
MIEQSVRLRIVVVRPPAGVRFCLQRGKENLDGATAAEGCDLHFDFALRARLDADGGVRLVGTFVQGPPTARFLYICVGACAGQLGSPWTRRVKVPLTGITWKQVEAANGLLEAAYEGTAKDGSPACATVKLIKPWSPV